MLAIVEGTGKLDNNAIASDHSDGRFRSIEASLHQDLHRTTANKRTEYSKRGLQQRGDTIRRKCKQKIQHMQRSSVTSPRRTEQKTWKSLMTS